MCEDFWNEIVNVQANINSEIFNFFKYQNPKFFLKDLYNANKTKIEKLVNNANDALIDLRHLVNRKEMPENENPDKVFDIVEEIHNFNKNQKVKGLKD